MKILTRRFRYCKCDIFLLSVSFIHIYTFIHLDYFPVFVKLVKHCMYLDRFCLLCHWQYSNDSDLNLDERNGCQIQLYKLYKLYKLCDYVKILLKIVNAELWHHTNRVFTSMCVALIIQFTFFPNHFFFIAKFNEKKRKHHKNEPKT